MARIRTVKPDFFRHEGLYEAEVACGLPLRLSFAGLFTAADREGRFHWSPRQLKLDCLPYDEVDFSAILDALLEYEFVIKYQVDGKTYGYIPTWHKHQHINQREAQSSLPSPTSESICTHVQTHGEGNGKEGEMEGVKSTVVSTTRRTDPFDEFWKQYPKRDGANPRTPAQKLFLAAMKSGVDPDAIIAGAKRCAAREAERVGTPFIPQAVKWLRDRRWEDYAPEPIKANATGPPQPPRPGLPTDAELRARYATRDATESERVLDEGEAIRGRPRGMGGDPTGQRGNGSMESLLQCNAMASFRDEIGPGGEIDDDFDAGPMA